MSYNPTLPAATTFKLVTAASQAPINVRNTPGKVVGWFIYNNATAARKVSFYNSATTVAVGSPTNLVFALVIPASSGANVSFSAGIDFPAGIAINTTKGIAEADTVLVDVNDLSINIYHTP
jgi:hypothetical protein